MSAPPVTLPNLSPPNLPTPDRLPSDAAAVATIAAPAVLAPTYYLDNFQLVLDWVEQRYADLLLPAEHAFVAVFRTLPPAARALLVRMVMRKGELFRTSRLQYDEIGDPLDAAAPLIALGWVEAAPAFDLATLFALFTKAELMARYPALARTPKAALLAQLHAEQDDAAVAQTLAAWLPGHADTVVRIAVLTLCDRLRLMFFGNGHQDWTEFILADLGIWRYEQVAFAPESRSFQRRGDIDDYLFLQDCRARFDEGAPVAEIVPALPAEPYANAWLEARRGALLFQLARHCERNAELELALTLYQRCGQRGARARMIRVLELLAQHAPALALAEQAEAAPHDHAEAQQVARMMARLRRRNGLAGAPAPAVTTPAPATERIVLRLPCPAQPCAVEEVAREALGNDTAPVFYVENALVNSLFGLLCWDVIFLPLPGAFFHPFHSGPVDLLSADFPARRAAQFAARLAEFDDGRYLTTIRANFSAKAGIVSPFVYWDVLDADLLELALHCIPAAHLKHWCERLLADLAANRSGFPDLIQFWPAERRYRMIEVKGPGDRLQDNQLRLLAFCAQHAMPAAVCYVEWNAP